MAAESSQANVNGQSSSGNNTDLERDTLAQQIAVPAQEISYFQLFRYATNKDLLIIIAISFLCAVVAGAITTAPALLTALLVGSIRESWSKESTTVSASGELILFTIYFVYLFVGELVTCYLATIGFIRTGIVLSSRIREHYLAALLRQNIAFFFDHVGAGEMATHLTADANLIRDGISEKVSVAVQCCSSIVTAFVIGFMRDWKLTLILASSPVCIALVLAVSGVALAAHQISPALAGRDCRSWDCCRFPPLRRSLVRMRNRSLLHDTTASSKRPNDGRPKPELYLGHYGPDG